MQGNINRIFFNNGIQSLLYPRCFSSSLVIQKCNSHSQKIYEKLNLPERPKRPLNPYFKFLQQVRPAVLKEYPDIKVPELTKIVSKRWSVVDSKLKEKLTQQYAEEFADYLKLKNKYDETLTIEQKFLIKEAQHTKTEQKEERKNRKKSKNLGKPKQPPGIFVKYLKTQLSERHKYPTVKDWMKAKSEEWKNVSDDVKAKLEEERKMEVERFNTELSQWEKRMIEEGNLDVVRKATLLPEPKTKLKK